MLLTFVNTVYDKISQNMVDSLLAKIIWVMVFFSKTDLRICISYPVQSIMKINPVPNNVKGCIEVYTVQGTVIVCHSVTSTKK
jgi:hypothetical protein